MNELLVNFEHNLYLSNETKVRCRKYRYFCTNVENKVVKKRSGKLQRLDILLKYDKECVLRDLPPVCICDCSIECVYSLEGPGVAVAVRLEVFGPHGRSGLKHLHEHHVTHHPQKTCMGKRNH